MKDPQRTRLILAAVSFALFFATIFFLIYRINQGGS